MTSTWVQVNKNFFGQNETQPLLSHFQCCQIHIVSSSHCSTPGESEEGLSAPKCDGRRIDNYWKTFLFVQDAIQCDFSSNVFKGREEKGKRISSSAIWVHTTPPQIFYWGRGPGITRSRGSQIVVDCPTQLFVPRQIPNNTPRKSATQIVRRSKLHLLNNQLNLD